MRYIYFSPHLDDAVLSAGGLISDQAKAGIPVEIWTFMSGVPDEEKLTDFAQEMHKIWGTTSAKETIQIRREEDKRAAARVGAKAVHFDFLDCIYRRGKNGLGLYEEAVFIQPHAEDADLPAQIAQTMIAWLKPDDVAVSQLAIGGHVDHILVRKAAEMLKRQLVYDMDIPYLLRHPEELGQKTAEMKESLQPVSEAGFESWLEGVEAYDSQISSLFDSLDSMRESLRTYWSERRGIQFWTI
jgi:LmbE family N-acetylglucosaminyl deacetylase